MIKNIELRRQNEINDIKAFRALIQRCFEVLDINETVFYSNYTPSKSYRNKIANGELSQDDENNRKKHKKLKLRHEITSKDRKDILNQIRSVAIDVVSGYSLIFKKQIVKKDVKQPIEDPSENHIIYQYLNKEEDIKELHDNNNIEYKLIEYVVTKEMQIDEGNNLNNILNREIDIIKEKNPLMPNIYENILSGRSEFLVRQNKERDYDSLLDIPFSKNIVELNDDSINNSKSSNFEIEEKIEDSDLNNDKNQIKIDQNKKDLYSNQGLLNLESDDFVANEQMIIDSKDNFNQITSEPKNKEIKDLEAYEEIKVDENNNKCNQEFFNNTFVSESNIHFLENEYKNETFKVTESGTKIKEKRHGKEYNYKIQNYRNLYGKTLFVNYTPLNYNDSTNPYLFPWYYIKCGNMKPFDIVNHYKKWIRDEETYKKDILKLPVTHINHINHEENNANKKGKKKKLGSRSNNVATNNQSEVTYISNKNPENIYYNKVIETEENKILYCYCKKHNNGEFMTGNLTLYS